MQRRKCSIIFTLLLLTGGLPLVAQVTAAGGSCTNGWATLGAIGVTSLRCDDCGFEEAGDRTWRFHSEPEIRSVDPDGPAAGRLRGGDVITAVDGMLITTRAAGARLANLRPRTPVTLTVRRNNREVLVPITPDEPCEPAAPPRAPLAAATPRPARGPTATTIPRTPRPAAVATAASPPTPVTLSPRAWFGFGISCRDCELNVSNHAAIEQAEAELRALLYRYDKDSAPVRTARSRIMDLRREGSTWTFGEYPKLFSVDPGSPAYDAGLRRSDVLLEIDGTSLITPEGARRFSRVDPGQTVSFTYRRGGSERTAQVRAIDRPTGALSFMPDEGLMEAMAGLERLQTERSQDLEEQAARLQETVARAAGEAGGDSRLRELAQLRAELERLNTTHSVETEVRMSQLREELALVEQARAGRLTPAPEDQHLRFAGSVGNTEVEVRGQSSVDVSYDNSTGELLIRTMDATIRVKAPVQR